MYNHFRPTPGRFGTQPSFVSGGAIGTTTLSDTATLAIYLPTPYRLCAIAGGSVVCTTLPISAGQTVTATLVKWDASASAGVNLSSAVSLLGLTVKNVAQLPLISTLSDAAKTLDLGDFLYINVAASGAVSTQPINLLFTAELLIQN